MLADLRREDGDAAPPLPRCPDDFRHTQPGLPRCPGAISQTWASPCDPRRRSKQAATVDLIHSPGSADAALDNISAMIKADDHTDLERRMTEIEQILEKRDSQPSW
jgi:hypothetical protein